MNIRSFRQVERAYMWFMERPILFRCPQTSMNVQHWLADDASEEGAGDYKAVTCPACTRLHFIHSATGKLLGDDSE